MGRVRENVLYTSVFVGKTRLKHSSFFGGIFCFPFLFCWGETLQCWGFWFGCFVLFWTLQFSTNMWNIYIYRKSLKVPYIFFFFRNVHGMSSSLKASRFAIVNGYRCAFCPPNSPISHWTKPWKIEALATYIDLKPRILTESIHSQSTTDSINKDGINMDHEKNCAERMRIWKRVKTNMQEPSPTTFNVILRAYGCLTTTIHDIVALFRRLNKLCQWLPRFSNTWPVIIVGTSSIFCHVCDIYK